MKTLIRETDTELKTNVLTELKYEPAVNIADIGVLVHNGTVTLNGFATSYGEKWNAVHAVKRVAGVNAIADDIVVKLPDSWERNDGDIAAAVASRLAWSASLPVGAVTVMVRDGWVTLEGQVEWWYQKNSADIAVRDLTGVKGVTNLITIKPKIVASQIEASIEAAFKRNALLDAEAVHVATSGNKVTLTGTVRNLAEHDEAQRVAWAAPGVFSVENLLVVESSWGLDD